VGDSGEQDLELYTEIALTYKGQILGIFIRDVTTPLLGMSPSLSSATLPCFFDGNGQPLPKQGRLAQLKGLRETWRGKSQEQIPTSSSFSHTETKESIAKDNELDELTLNDIDLFSSLNLDPELAEDDVLEDLPLRTSKTPPTHPQRSPSSSSIHSTNSETSDFPSPPQTLTQELRAEEQSSRVKRVENWKRRLTRARERLTQANSGVEVWTWRVGSDVQKICENLVIKEYNNRGGK
jgi:Phosphatidate phosphatase APP1, catalytic domain